MPVKKKRTLTKKKPTVRVKESVVEAPSTSVTETVVVTQTTVEPPTHVESSAPVEAEVPVSEVVEEKEEVVESSQDPEILATSGESQEEVVAAEESVDAGEVPVEEKAEPASTSEDTYPKVVATEETSPENSQFGSFRNEELNQKKKGKLIPILLFIIMFLAAAVGALYFLTSPYNTFMSKAEPTPTPAPIVAEPTPEEIDLTAYSIQVLNGSGIAGEAANAQSSLQDAGFKVPEIGNAPDSNFEDTQIAAKSDVSKEFLKKLQESLEANYGVSSEILELDDSDTSDVVVTLGSNIN